MALTVNNGRDTLWAICLVCWLKGLAMFIARHLGVDRGNKLLVVQVLDIGTGPEDPPQQGLPS